MRCFYSFLTSTSVREVTHLLLVAILFLTHFYYLETTVSTHEHEGSSYAFNKMPHSGRSELASKVLVTANTQRPFGSTWPSKSCSLAMAFHASTNFIIARFMIFPYFLAIFKFKAVTGGF